MRSTWRLAFSDPLDGDWSHWRSVMFARLRLMGLAYAAVVVLCGVAAVVAVTR